MKILIMIGTGSFIGGMFRYLVSQFIDAKTTAAFPLGTSAVNIAGCLLIGIIYGFAMQGKVNHEWRLFLATGILGGFTTFSAFSYETVTLMRDGQFIYAFGYVAASVLLGFAATFAGMQLVK